MYQLPFGKNTLFPAAKKEVTIQEITDGTSNTIMLLEVTPDKAVDWTKPEDFEVDAKDPLAGLKGAANKMFTAGFADGSVRSISEKLDPAAFKALLTPQGGEVVNVP